MQLETVTIEQGLDLMLSMFQEPLWPRNVSTASTQDKQYCVEDRARALVFYNAAQRKDCRIAVFPNYDEILKNLQTQETKAEPIPNHIFIDLDAKDFNNDINQLNAALKSTLRRMHKELNGAVPTILWSGAGYHLHQPLDIPQAFEYIEEFKKYENVSVRFLRYAARRLTGGKSDPNHNVSFKSSIARVPGSINTKYADEPEVKILQRWNGIRAKPSRQFVGSDFLITLVQKEIDENSRNYKIVKTTNSGTTTPWIEKLLQTPIADYRRNARDLILIPYLVVRKGLAPSQVYDTVMAWAEKSSELRPLQPSHSAYADRVKTRIQEVVQHKIPPMTFAKFQEVQPEIAAKLVNGKDINISHNNIMTNNMQSINEKENQQETQNKKLLSQKALENLRKNKEQKARDSKYISWEDGEEKELYFDPEKIRQVPSKFGDDNKRYEYTVVDVRNFPDMEKLWTVGKKTSDKIDEFLADGHSILLVECEGEGTNRKFKISPRD